MQIRFIDKICKLQNFQIIQSVHDKNLKYLIEHPIAVMTCCKRDAYPDTSFSQCSQGILSLGGILVLKTKGRKNFHLSNGKLIANVI